MQNEQLIFSASVLQMCIIILDCLNGTDRSQLFVKKKKK